VSTTNALEQQLYNERFLLKRALLQAIDHAGDTPPILLIDEIDRADDEFEAYLLEVLSEYQITVPEIGRFSAVRPPLVILTSNRTRDVHDALKRRCLYHWVEHPDFEREVLIVRMRVPQALDRLARQVAGAVEALRTLNLYKPPGVAETTGGLDLERRPWRRTPLRPTRRQARGGRRLKRLRQPRCRRRQIPRFQRMHSERDASLESAVRHGGFRAGGATKRGRSATTITPHPGNTTPL